MPWQRVVTHQAGRVFSYTDWIEPLPRIPSDIVNSIVYMYKDLADADGGSPAGASGFLVWIRSKVTRRKHVFVVTNRHVIEDGFAMVRTNLKNPAMGQSRVFTFPFDAESWLLHERHDLALRMIPPDYPLHDLNATFLSIHSLITQTDLDRHSLGPGSDLFYVGRFRDHAGRWENMPSVRFGNISMMPNEREPIECEVRGRTIKQIGYLVEARSRSGYSGSPVFVYQQVTRALDSSFGVAYPSTHFDPVEISSGIGVLGVDWGHIPEEVQLIDSKSKHLLPSSALVHAGMMGVVPGWYLKDFLEHDQRVQQQIRDAQDFQQNTLGALGAID